MEQEVRVYAADMATFSRSEDGVWTVSLDESDGDDRNPAFDEAVPRYFNVFDPAFAKAEEVEEAEFVKALLRVRSMQDAGWDPYDTTLHAVPAAKDNADFAVLTRLAP